MEHQPQVTPEMLKKLQGEKEENTKTKPAFSGSGNKHWIIKFGKDIAYISFFPYLWIKDFFTWLFPNKQNKLKQSVNINKVDIVNTEVSNNAISEKTGQITLQETASPSSDISLAELTTEATSSSNRNDRWNQNMINDCEHQESISPVVTTVNNRLTT